VGATQQERCCFCLPNCWLDPISCSYLDRLHNTEGFALGDCRTYFWELNIHYVTQLALQPRIEGVSKTYILKGKPMDERAYLCMI